MSEMIRDPVSQALVLPDDGSVKQAEIDTLWEQVRQLQREMRGLRQAGLALCDFLADVPQRPYPFLVEIRRLFEDGHVFDVRCGCPFCTELRESGRIAGIPQRSPGQ